MADSSSTMQWDFFISHASEEKESLARPIAEGLRSRGMAVWIDEEVLQIGDSLRRKIDHGLANSRFAVVLVSKALLAKEWPQRELDALLSREDDGSKVILPVWHDVGLADVLRRSPILASRVAIPTGLGIPRVVEMLVAAARTDSDTLRPQESAIDRCQSRVQDDPEQIESVLLHSGDGTIGSVAELVAILTMRGQRVLRAIDESELQASEAINSGRGYWSSTGLKVRLNEVRGAFVELHARHLDALRAGRLVEAHEIASEIQYLLWLNDKNLFWGAHHMHGAQYLLKMTWPDSRLYPGLLKEIRDELREGLALESTTSRFLRDAANGTPRKIGVLAQEELRRHRSWFMYLLAKVHDFADLPRKILRH